MKYCRNCGTQLHDEAKVCPKCWGSTGTIPKENDRSSIGWGILGFLMPFLGLILYIVWRDDMPLRGKSIGVGALICTLISVVLWTIFIIILAITFNTVGIRYY